MRSLPLPYSGTSWKRHYGGGKGQANISLIYTSEIKRESAGKAARGVLAGRGQVPCEPAGTPAGWHLGPELLYRRSESVQMPTGVGRIGRDRVTAIRAH